MIRRLIALASLLILIGGIAVGAYAWYNWKAMQAPLTLPQAGVTYQLEAGTTLRSLSRDLARRGWVANPWYVEIWGRWVEPGGSVQAGEYDLEPGMHIADVLALLRKGKAKQYRITVLEGSRFRDFALQLADLVDKGQIRATVGPQGYAAMFRELTGESHEEGWIFPDTYQYSRGDTDRSLLLRAYRRMRSVLDQAWTHRTAGLPLKSAYEALILASIVEKETGVADERATIAGVFIRRLNKGMKLQTDPTVVYGMGERYKGNIHKADLRQDTPYNTYTRKGLPPTPIALPGAGSIEAAVHPNDTGALFFVAKGGGRHYFSKTYREHRKAVIKYLLGGDKKRYRGDS